MDRPNNQHSMVFRCEATWKERDAITRRFRRQANLSRFRDAASRDARRGPRIVVGRRRKRAAAARGSAAASEPKIPEASARKAKRAKSEGAVCVCGVNRLFTQVRHTSSWPGKSYLKNNSRSFEIVVSLLESPVPVSGFCEDVLWRMQRLSFLATSNSRTMYILIIREKLPFWQPLHGTHNRTHTATL